MAKIRVGLIGLSTNTQPMTAGTWGITAHLRPIQALADYEIVAVANSTVASAKRSIEHHGLPAETKAYGSPDEIAADPDVDLVVVSVNVAKHFYLAKPALEKGKDIFVEWPLGASIAEAEELTRLATANNVRTIVGLQARADPAILKLKEVLASNKIGRIVSSVFTASTATVPVDMWPHGAEYYLDFKSGGNEFTIFFGHLLDTFVHVLGDFSDVQGLLKSQYTTVPVIDPSTGEVLDPAHAKSSPDHIFVQGILLNGAVSSLSLRKPKAAADEVGFRWIITGTDGELVLTAPERHWQFGLHGRSSDWSLRLKKGKETGFQEIDLKDLDTSPASMVEQPGTNTARLYQSFAEGQGLEATFESATKTHRLLERIAKSAGWEL
ncbi:hypothetical protein PFICI_14891 [Pestalotiopsis fici W106-1]|uniref:Uncharacterized protein n=1 Tax=Pestalotiopsis fici (strain W106-1 / CGMCC3.15140) TaxID=1229662 RepID=W3WKF2_PESFW|nr:uncharacterized protein PFICI_14891 [Pestalotiopsis fici W106-1]ETS73286.1 hypothetical protein PFICI_14891 [Pestalotiopsis fici W106-1]